MPENYYQAGNWIRRFAAEIVRKQSTLEGNLVLMVLVKMMYESIKQLKHILKFSRRSQGKGDISPFHVFLTKTL